VPYPVLQNSAEAQKYAQAPREVQQAIRQASASTGVDFSYLMAKAAAESSFNTNAEARTSSAKGLYQFIDQTWLTMVKRHGADHGLGQYADAIEQGANGRMTVSDPELKQEILDLRFDPSASASMAAEFARENGDYIEAKLGREANATDLYMAHFLGAGGAAKFLSAMEKNPTADAASLVPQAAAANRNVFYDRKTGEAKSLGEVYDFFANKFGDDGGSVVADARPSVPRTRTASVSTGSGSALGGSLSGFTASGGNLAGRFDDAILQQLLDALSSGGNGLRSVAGVAGSQGSFGQGLLTQNLLLLAQEQM
jgi:hypothetical protein